MRGESEEDGEWLEEEEERERSDVVEILVEREWEPEEEEWRVEGGTMVWVCEVAAVRERGREEGRDDGVCGCRWSVDWEGEWEEEEEEAIGLSEAEEDKDEDEDGVDELDEERFEFEWGGVRLSGVVGGGGNGGKDWCCRVKLSGM